MVDDRAFQNQYDDWREDLRAELPLLKEKILTNVSKFIDEIECRLESDVDIRDTSVYTGTSGIALLYFHLYTRFPRDNDKSYLIKADKYVTKALKHVKKHRISFLCGAPGPYALAAIIKKELGDDIKTKALTSDLFQLSSIVLSSEDDKLPDELLYGRCGYLYSLLLLKKHGIEVEDDLMKQVVDAIVNSGKRLSHHEKSKFPLMYRWHDKCYFGAAHGMIGIMYLLLEAKLYVDQSDLKNFVKPTVDCILSLQFSSGNFPSSLGNSADKLIHWCHGAPGAVHLFLKSFKMFDDEKYLMAAKSCCKCIWERGLLTKGFGICHGVSGNAYAFLHHFQVMKDDESLYRALKFAEWCIDTDRRKCRTPDRPISLFEGLAGVIYFLADLKEPSAAAFPAFQL